ncbi:MAG: hypothetical protein GWP19_15305 [Planctomycetia bacterium]|nr:hypothetical protein [Planctomycetia bacterium]
MRNDKATSYVTFGQFIHYMRLNKQFGLRYFAREIGWQPSNLSNLEHGRLKPPQDKNTLLNFAEVLGIDKDSNEYKDLFKLAAQENNKIIPADIEEFVSGKEAIPVLFRTMNDHKFKDGDIRKLIEHIRDHYKK